METASDISEGPGRTPPYSGGPERSNTKGWAVALVGGAILAVAGVAWLAPRFVDGETARAIVAAVAICTGAGVLGMAPVFMVIGRHPDYLVQAGMAMILIRLFLTLTVGWAYLGWAGPPENAYYLAMVVCYLVLLGVETGLTVLLIRRSWRPPQASGSKV